MSTAQLKGNWGSTKRSRRRLAAVLQPPPQRIIMCSTDPCTHQQKEDFEGIKVERFPDDSAFMSQAPAVGPILVDGCLERFVVATELLWQPHVPQQAAKQKGEADDGSALGELAHGRQPTLLFVHRECLFMEEDAAMIEEHMPNGIHYEQHATERDHSEWPPAAN